MNQHIVKSYDDEMKELSAEVMRMASLARDQLESAIDALETRNLEEAARVKKNDKQVDAINDDIEERVMSILALRQPVAVDLRETVSTLKIARELERIGDLSKNIAKRTKVIVEFDQIAGTDTVIQMGRHCVRTMEDVLLAIEKRASDGALDIWCADEPIDEYCNQAFAKILRGVTEAKSDINACIQMTFVAKNLERIGDHATSIAESIFYVVTGDRIEEKRPKSDKTSTTTIESVGFVGEGQ